MFELVHAPTLGPEMTRLLAVSPVVGARALYTTAVAVGAVGALNDVPVTVVEVRDAIVRGAKVATRVSCAPTTGSCHPEH